MRLIEISGLIENGMWNYGDELKEEIFSGPKIIEVSNIKKDGFSAHRFEMSILTGTYLETGAHILENVKTVDQVPVEELFLECSIIKLKEKISGEHIKVEELEKSGIEVKEGDCLIIYTGWYKMWNKNGFVLNSPHFEYSAMDWIISKKVKILAGDIPCYDDIRDPSDSKNLPNLRKLYLSGAMCLAPVINGDKVESGRSKIVIMPLRVKGVSASPSRAVLIL
ncbi:MAG TPA: cyclase family protein [bacterium]|nr:cyclase family protein [bacterium]HOM26172.1 cyclase family protein [bacterium]